MAVAAPLLLLCLRALRARLGDWGVVEHALPVAHSQRVEVMAGRCEVSVAIAFRVAKVLDMKDIFADEHYAARNMIAEVDGIKMQNVVAGMSRTPGKLRHAGRSLGADNGAVLGRLKKRKK